MAWNSIGKITVATSGTLVQVMPPTGIFIFPRTIVVSTAGNTGAVSIGLKGFNRTTGVGVLAIVPQNLVIQLGDQGAGLQFDGSSLWLDAATSGDGAFFSYFD